MPEFAYTAKTIQGGSVEGTLTAAGRSEALAVLVGKSLYPIDVNSSASPIILLATGLRGFPGAKDARTAANPPRSATEVAASRP